MVEKLLIRLIGDGSSYRAMLDGASKQTQRFSKNLGDVGKRLKTMGGDIRNFGTTMSLGVTLPLVGVGTAAVNSFSKFDQAMTQSTSIMEVTEAQTKRMRDTALSLASQGTQGPSKLAESYFFLASAGLDAEQSMAALPQVMKFATAGAFDMALATDLLTDAQSALGLTSKDAQENLKGMTRVSDVLVKANTLANASVQQFSEALTNTAGATLKNFNKSVEEGVAVLAAYADQGIKAQVAGTNLTRVTLLLQQAAQKNADAHAALGFSVFDSQGKMNSYSNIVGQLERITAGMSDETKAATLAQLGFQARVQNAILPLIGMSDQIDAYQSALEGAAGTTGDVANKQMASFTNQMKVLNNELSALGVEVGEILVPALIGISKHVRELIKWFKSLDGATKSSIVVFGGLLAAMGPVLVTVGTLISSVGSVVSAIGTIGPSVVSAGAFLLSFTNPVTAVIAIVVGLIATIRLFAGSWENASNMIGNAMDMIVDFMITGTRIMSRIIVAFVGWMRGRFKELWEIDWINAIIMGIKFAAIKLTEFGRWAMRKLRSIFTGEETGTFDQFLSTLQGDLKRGAQQRDFLKTISDITREEIGLHQGRRATVEFGQPRTTEPVQVEVKESKDKASKDVKDMAVGIKQLVELTEKQLAGPSVELSPLGGT